MKTTITNEVLNIHVSMDGATPFASPFASPGGAGPFATFTVPGRPSTSKGIPCQRSQAF
jgi:hypothetical protein